ncbi:hypothetical protein SteCoe_22978 [Stentor coeruleus]|uniref:Uncharacterized protein n=1 Tax=Stentor coeruleus TaxID=5963 RepID=A0A1R2BL08_9CILI|nr:hypothetical protein SteCoe_22978 [Stentor coeruleus]
MGNLFAKEKNDPKIEGLYLAMKGEKNVDISADDREFRTEAQEWSLLHLAVWFLNIEMIKKLINLGFDLNLRDIHGDTPLHLAAYQNNKEIYEYLINQGADDKVKNKEDKTPGEMFP